MTSKEILDKVCNLDKSTALQPGHMPRHMDHISNYQSGCIHLAEKKCYKESKYVNETHSFICIGEGNTKYKYKYKEILTPPGFGASGRVIPRAAILLSALIWKKNNDS